MGSERETDDASRESRAHERRMNIARRLVRSCLGGRSWGDPGKTVQFPVMPLPRRAGK